jgi:O-antigen ligase
VSAVAREPIGALLWRLWRDPAAWITTSDIFVILIVLSLPWSTSLVAIFAVATLVTMVPFFDARAFLQSLRRPVCTVPIALVCARGAGNAVVGRAVGRAAICGRAGRKTADAAGAVLSF